MNANTNFFDISLDDIADLPEFKNFPPVAYQVEVSLEKKDINKHPAVVFNLKCIKVLELVDPDSEEIAEGTESNVSYIMDNEFGAGKFKAIVAPLAELYETRNVAEIIRKAKNVSALVVIGSRKAKETNKEYMELISLEII